MKKFVQLSIEIVHRNIFTGLSKFSVINELTDINPIPVYASPAPRLEESPSLLYFNFPSGTGQATYEISYGVESINYMVFFLFFSAFKRRIGSFNNNDNPRYRYNMIND